MEPHRSHSPNNSSSGNSNGGTSSGNNSSGSGTKEATGGNPSAGAPASGNSRHSGGKSDRGNRKPIILPTIVGSLAILGLSAPHKVRSVRSPDSDTPAQSEVMFVPGLDSRLFF